MPRGVTYLNHGSPMDPSHTSSASTPCHEFVRFAFAKGTTPDDQRAHMTTIDVFVRAQPGFVARCCYYDPSSDVWIDHVTWQDEQAANAALERARDDAALGPAFAAISRESIAFGHFTRHL